MGTRDRRLREKEQRRADILRAARALFWKRGFGGTTMPDVARAAEVAPGTLYLYFPSKDALYAELLVEGYEALIAHLEAQAKPNAGPRRQAEALVDAFFGFAHDNPEYFDVIFFVLQRAGVGESVLGDEQLARIRALEARAKQPAIDVLAASGRRRVVRDAARIVDVAWSMLVGVVSSWGKDPAFPALAPLARRMIVDALLPEER